MNKDKPKFQANKFVNDFFKDVMKLRVKAFGLYHQCMLKCYKDPKSKEIRKCQASCEMKLDDYMEFESALDIQTLYPFVIYPNKKSFEVDAQGQGISTSEMINNYNKVLYRLEEECEKSYQKLNDKIGDWEKEI